jgi:hypothetical protein
MIPPAVLGQTLNSAFSGRLRLSVNSAKSFTEDDRRPGEVGL